MGRTNYPGSAAIANVPLPIGDQVAAGTTAILYDIIAPFDGRVTGVYALDTATLALSDSDYMTITVTNLGAAGAGTTVVAKATTETYDATLRPYGLAANFSALIPKVIKLAADATTDALTDAATKFSAGDVLQVTAVATGSGAFTAGQVFVFAVPGQ